MACASCAARIGDRASAALGTMAVALLCVYALSRLDWRPLEINGALAGLAVGLVLFALIPARYVLHRAQALPNAAALMLLALVLTPVALLTPVGFVWGSMGHASLRDTSSSPFRLRCRATPPACSRAASRWVFARRKRMRVAALDSAALGSLGVLGLWTIVAGLAFCISPVLALPVVVVAVTWVLKSDLVQRRASDERAAAISPPHSCNVSAWQGCSWAWWECSAPLICVQILLVVAKTADATGAHASRRTAGGGFVQRVGFDLC